MNDRSSRTWSGLDLSPLPHESTYSILLRFAWRNAQNASKMKRLYTGKVATSKDASLYSWSWSSPHFERVTGWMASALDVDGSLLHLDRFWLKDQLHICPLCLECGYHSFWFQFAPLKMCPIHNCELSKTCHSCGSELGNYDLSKRLFDRPYICDSCNKPICGVAQNLQLHLDFRSQSQLLAYAFRPIADWVAALPSNARLMQSLVYNCKEKAHTFNFWCRRDDFFMSIGHYTHPLPPECSAPPYTELAVLSWRIKKPLFFGSYGEFYDKRFNRDRLLRIAAPVYRGTLRMLQKWILGLDRAVGPEISLAPIFSVDGVVQVQCWDPRELAYMLLRSQFESEGKWGLHSYVGYAQLSRQAAWVKWQNKSSGLRLGWRAYFLAVYAGLLHLILRAKGRGTLNLREIRIDASYLVADYSESDESYYGGGVVFPAVDGLPLWPFIRNICSDSLAWNSANAYGYCQMQLL